MCFTGWQLLLSTAESRVVASLLLFCCRCWCCSGLVIRLLLLLLLFFVPPAFCCYKFLLHFSVTHPLTLRDLLFLLCTRSCSVLQSALFMHCFWIRIFASTLPQHCINSAFVSKPNQTAYFLTCWFFSRTIRICTWSWSLWQAARCFRIWDRLENSRASWHIVLWFCF